MRHLRAASVLAFFSLLLSLLFVPSASAATANGRCSSAGQSVKIGGKTYVCAQNPTLKSKALRWTLKDCLSANTQYLRAIKSLSETEVSTDKILEVLDIQIRSLEAQLPIDEQRIASELEKAEKSKSLAADKSREAESKLNALAALGVNTVPDAWLRDYTALLGLLKDENRKMTQTDLNVLSKRWNLSIETQLVPVIQYLTIRSQIKSALDQAADYTASADNWRKSQKTLESVKSQRVTTETTQKALIGLARDDVKGTLKVRNVSCRTK